MTSFIERGIAAAHAQDLPGALVWFQRAHAHEPHDLEATAWLGQTLCHLGRRVDGLVHLAAAGQGLLRDVRTSATDRDVGRVFEVLTQLQLWRGFDEALALVRELTVLQPGNARAHYQRAVTCGQVSLAEEAMTAAREATRLAPDNAMFQVLRASLEADARQFEAAYDRLDAALEGLASSAGSGDAATQTTHARAVFRGLKETARVLDALAEYDSVFPQLDAAADVAALLPEYADLPLQTLPERIRGNAAGFTRQGMSRFAGHAFPDQPRAPVFLMGFFRSGTTLAQEVLRSHPGVFLSDEVGLVHLMELELHRMEPGTEPVAAKLARVDHAGISRLRAAYWRGVQGQHGAASDDGVFIDKFTLGTVDLGLISTVFPDARVLFVMRDPRDVCLSCVMQLMVPTAATRHLLRLSSTAALYAQVMTWWLQVRQQMPIAHLTFKYEDAVTDFEATFRRVFDFIGLDWHDDALTFHQRIAGRHVASPSRNQVAQPLYRSSVARWRRYETAMAPVQETLAPFVTHFGYPPA